MNVKALLEARESMKWQKTFKFSSWEKKADNQMGMCKEKKKHLKKRLSSPAGQTLVWKYLQPPISP